MRAYTSDQKIDNQTEASMHSLLLSFRNYVAESTKAQILSLFY